MWANFGLLLMANANARQLATSTNMMNTSLRLRQRKNVQPGTQPVAQQSVPAKSTKGTTKTSTISRASRPGTAPKI